ncbi:MAG TPA: heme-binding protein, partial [Pelomicrobium sp.]|nr:heme-binding protein [Pelomicrobium sp.]
MTAAMVLTGCTVLSLEKPDYAVVEQREALELRRYEPYVVAEVTLAGDFESVGNEAFPILAGYIGGKNRGEQKI